MFYLLLHVYEAPLPISNVHWKLVLNGSGAQYVCRNAVRITISRNPKKSEFTERTCKLLLVCHSHSVLIPLMYMVLTNVLVSSFNSAQQWVAGLVLLLIPCTLHSCGVQVDSEWEWIRWWFTRKGDVHICCHAHQLMFYFYFCNQRFP